MHGRSREGKRARFVLSLSSSSLSPGFFCCLQLSRCGHIEFASVQPRRDGLCLPPPAWQKGLGRWSPVTGRWGQEVSGMAAGYSRLSWPPLVGF